MKFGKEITNILRQRYATFDHGMSTKLSIKIVFLDTGHFLARYEYPYFLTNYYKYENNSVCLYDPFTTTPVDRS